MRRANLSVCQVIDDIAHILGPDSNRIHTVCVDMVIDHCNKVLDQRIGNQRCIAYRRPGRQRTLRTIPSDTPMTVLSRYCCGVRILNANFEAMETSKSDTMRWPFTANSAASIAPTSRVERYASLDVLRGAALLGILIMNIQGFAMVVAYVNPSVHMDLSGLNWWIWSLSHALADMKFMALFSILFGAGIVLGTARRDRIGQPSFSFFYRRYAWLLLFGLIHAYFLWHGDILVTYAICAFAVYWLRGLM